MKNLILIRGLPGAGKTTFAEMLYSFTDPNVPIGVFASDDYFTDEEGNYNFDANRLKQAHEQCQNNTLNFIKSYSKEEEVIVLVHNTFTTESEMTFYLNLAVEYGYRVTTLIVENREGRKSVHNVPEFTLQKMKTRFNIKL